MVESVPICCARIFREARPAPWVRPTSQWPSGLQPISSSPPGNPVSLVAGLLPSATWDQAARPSGRVERKPTLLPSGDHAGRSLVVPSKVRRVGAPAGSDLTKRWMPSPTTALTTILDSSGARAIPSE